MWKPNQNHIFKHVKSFETLSMQCNSCKMCQNHIRNTCKYTMCQNPINICNAFKTCRNLVHVIHIKTLSTFVRKLFRNISHICHTCIAFRIPIHVIRVKRVKTLFTSAFKIYLYSKSRLLAWSLRLIPR